MLKELKDVIFLIGVGLTIGFTLIVYAHANFATKTAVKDLKKDSVEHRALIRDDIKQIKNDVRDIKKYLIKP